MCKKLPSCFFAPLPYNLVLFKLALAPSGWGPKGIFLELSGLLILFNHFCNKHKIFTQIFYEEDWDWYGPVRIFYLYFHEGMKKKQYFSFSHPDFDNQLLNMISFYNFIMILSFLLLIFSCFDSLFTKYSRASFLILVSLVCQLPE